MADETKRPAFRAVLATCAFALLCARAVDAQILANGKTLTVTTTNAVATFNGPDLVGFANSLTGETYLKKPSIGDLVRVNAIASTGQALQTSNWTVATEQGTGLPLATITAQDSARTFTMTVKIDPASQEIVLRSSASVTSGGVRGASWSIAGLDLTGGRWIVPANSGAVFDAAHPGINAFIAYPNSWQAQMAVYQAAAGSFLLYSTDTQIYFKDLRQTTRGDSTLDVAVYTEAPAPWPSATAVPLVEWRLKAFAGDWRAAATPYRDWMLANHPPVSNAAHPWVSNIRNVVAVGALDSTILAPLAAQLNPAQTLLYLVNWRQSSYDVNYPDYTPAAGAAAFVTAAHTLGFKVMLHTDILGVTPTNPDYASVQQYQTRTPDTLQLTGWNWDQPTVLERYGLIDPAASAYRALWIARIGVAINLLNPDALHLDFTAMSNDGNGPIEGRTFPQGEDYFNQQIIAAFPNVALGSEEEYDFTYRYHSFAQMGFWAFQSAGHPITNFLFSPQVEYYGHLGNPQVTDPAFKTALMRQMQIGAFPMWWVYAPSSIDTTDPDIARFIQMAKAWQNNAFQPAWTEDWTGALIRFRGLNGATAALTDSGGLFSLQSSQSTLFTLAHEANRLSSAGFVDGWAAFDDSTLYGLDPSVLYFLDPQVRPNATHATSLPPGIRLGPGTWVTPSFAHLELAPPTPFDFANLSNARMGINYQAVDYSLGFGALVQAQTSTVGGVSRSGISIQPPWQGQIGGETFAEYSVPVPAGAALQLSVGIDDGATCTDGVTFRVTAGGTELWHQNFNRGAWHDVVLSLAAYAGSTVPIRLISNPGPAANSSCDWAIWSGVALVAPTPAISVPIRLATASIFSGIDGATYTPVSGSTGTVTNVTVPGGFTIFTQPGSAVVSGTNLATLPFDVGHWDNDGTPPKPGSVFNAGSVQSETSGGVTKNPAIWAHPPNASRAVLSWTLRLPANPLQLGWNAGLIDGANSDDGVAFEVRVNGLPYWSLVTGVHGDNHWTVGQLDLSRWQGQSILLELITDSRSNYNGDWAAWAALVLGPSAGGCSYSVPSSASVGAIGGSFTANITTSPPCSWSAVPSVPWITVTAGSGAGNGSVAYSVAANPGGKRTGTLTIAGQALTVTQDALAATMTLDKTVLNFGAVTNGATLISSTQSQAVRLTQTGTGTVTWTATSNAAWLRVANGSGAAGSSASGSGSATLNISVVFASGLSTTQQGSITLALTGAGNTAGPIGVTLGTIPNGTAAAPVGAFDTPADNSTGVTGSIAVTGWAMDDVGVTGVRIMRNPLSGEAATAVINGQPLVFIGDAVLVDGARPDVAALFPNSPRNTSAGWGYLMLTNFLPGLGNGTFVLTAVADDADGHSTILGTKTITCTNADIRAPFGAIDTPVQGGTVSGTLTNFGWVLVPGPARADPPGGGTVRIVIDGALIATVPGGWTSRSDLSTLFSDTVRFPGISTALGVAGFDTSTLTNGVHTIAWLVTDNLNRPSGIGSRYFTVSNGSGLQLASPSAMLARRSGEPLHFSPAGRRGPDLTAPFEPLTPGPDGVLTFRAEALDRIELQLQASAGRLRSATGELPLPIGSRIDPADGAFTWQPGPGFIGRYDFVFDTVDGSQRVQILLLPQGMLSRPQVVIDLPEAGSTASGQLTVAGWALDPNATTGTGIDAIHVWAYPVHGGLPIFLGPASLGGDRPDVAKIYGAKALKSGYGLTVNSLPAGEYNVAVFAWKSGDAQFLPASTRRVVVQ